MRVSAGFNKARFGLSPFNTAKRITRTLDLNIDTEGIGTLNGKFVRISSIKNLVTIGTGHTTNNLVRITGINNLSSIGTGEAVGKLVKIQLLQGLISQGTGHTTNNLVRITGINNLNTSGLGKTSTSTIKIKNTKGESIGNGFIEGKVVRIRNLENMKSVGYGEAECFAVIILESIIQYLGDLPPGATLIIDSDKFTIELNGVSALDQYNGDFHNLDRNTQLTYQDEETSRNLNLSIMFREQFI